VINTQQYMLTNHITENTHTHYKSGRTKCKDIPPPTILSRDSVSSRSQNTK